MGVPIDTRRVHDTPVNGLAFGQNERTVYTGASDGAVAQWDRTEGGIEPQVVTFNSPVEFGNVSALTVDSFATHLVVGYSSGIVRLFRIPDGDIYLTSELHTDLVADLATHPLGGTVLSASYDSKISIWQYQSNEPPTVIEPPRSTPQAAVAYAPTGDQFAVAGVETPASIWETASLDETPRVLGHPLTTLLALEYVPSTGELVAVDMEGVVRLYELESGTESQRIHVGENGEYPLAVARSEPLVAVGTDESLNIYDLSTGDLVGYHRVPDAGVFSVAFSPENQCVAVGCGDGEIRVYATPSIK